MTGGSGRCTRHYLTPGSSTNRTTPPKRASRTSDVLVGATATATPAACGHPPTGGGCPRGDDPARHRAAAHDAGLPRGPVRTLVGVRAPPSPPHADAILPTCSDYGHRPTPGLALARHDGRPLRLVPWRAGL